MFDPYHRWLLIPPRFQPPHHHYQLLGLAVYESDPEVIVAAAAAQTARVVGFAEAPDATTADRILTEIRAARYCLLDPSIKAAYDETLRVVLSGIHVNATEKAKTAGALQAPVPAFDPYYKWLGIPQKDQPPNHYRLLGLELFESDPDVIDAAADRQMTFIRSCTTGVHVGESQKLLNELSAVRICLLKADTKAVYDAGLRQQIAAAVVRFPAAPESLHPVVPARNEPAPSSAFDKSPKSPTPSVVAPSAIVPTHRSRAATNTPIIRQRRWSPASIAVVTVMAGAGIAIALPLLAQLVLRNPSNSPTAATSVPPAKPVNVPSEPVGKPVNVPSEPVGKPVNVPSEPVGKPVKVPSEPAGKPVNVPSEPAVKPVNVPSEPVFVSNLQEKHLEYWKYMPNWGFGKNGRLERKPDGSYAEITLGGMKSPNGIFAHPKSNGRSNVQYEIGQLGTNTFEATIGVDDARRYDPSTPLTFEVLGDGKSLWQSKPVKRWGEPQECKVDVSGVNTLELRVTCPGNASFALAVWCEPRLMSLAAMGLSL